MNIALIATSPRENSNSLRFAGYLKKNIDLNGNNVNTIDFSRFDIPNVGRGSIDSHNLTAFQQELIETWDNASLIIFVTPEYNWTINGDLLTALHQLGVPTFAHLFHNKTFALAGVSTGRGGRTPCLELTTVLNKIINFTNQYSIVCPRIYESHETPKNLDENADSTGNTLYEATTKAFIDYAMNVAKRWNNILD